MTNDDPTTSQGPPIDWDALCPADKRAAIGAATAEVLALVESSRPTIARAAELVCWANDRAEDVEDSAELAGVAGVDSLELVGKASGSLALFDAVDDLHQLADIDRVLVEHGARRLANRASQLRSGQRPALSGETCSCGLPASVVYETEKFGDVPHCGVTH